MEAEGGGWWSQEGEEEEEEGAGSRTRGRLHCETAISRDEAFLNKQNNRRRRRSIRRLVYQAESSLWLWRFYFQPHCLAFSPSPPQTSEGPHWQSNLVFFIGGVVKVPRWLGFFVCVLFCFTLGVAAL